jgi:SAM-dependent methyltransferase
MRYYCESHSESVNHVTPSILMLDSELQRQDNQLKASPTILDLGCGNGRSSLYLAKKYKSSDVVLIDCDLGMLKWAEELFNLQGCSAKAICTTVEELASEPCRLNEKTGISKFDIVIFSYVIQHIDPVYYPIVFDFCRRICSGYMAIGVFWNPSRLNVGDFTTIDTVSWYGLSYEELVILLAPRFRIVNDRVLRTSISVMINMLLTEGQTLLASVLRRNYEYYSGRHRRSMGTDSRTRPIRRIINIDDLQCTKLLSSLYPSEFDLVRTEMTQWLQSCDRITPSLAAAKFLWCCRINKIPAMLNEVSEDFGTSTKRIIQTMSEIDYVPTLQAAEYVDRLSKQLKLCDFVREAAINLVSESMEGSSPTIRACCAIIRAAEAQGIRITKDRVASILDVTPVGINMALKRDLKT